MVINYKETFDGSTILRLYTVKNIEWYSSQRLYGTNVQLQPVNYLKIDGETIDVKYPGIASMVILNKGLEIKLPSLMLNVTQKPNSYDLYFKLQEMVTHISLEFKLRYTNIDRDYKLKIDDLDTQFEISSHTNKIWSETKHEIVSDAKILVERLDNYVIDKEYNFTIFNKVFTDNLINILLHLILLDYIVIPEMDSYL